MNKQQYIDQLNDYLSSLPRNEREKILYEALMEFEIGEKEGKSERYIISELGDPKTFAKQFSPQSPRTTYEEKTIKINDERFQSTLILILLIVFNMMFVLGPAIAIGGILIAFYAVSFSLIGAPLILFARMIYFSSGNILVLFFFVLFLVSLGFLIFAGTNKLGALMKRVFTKYIRFNKRLVKGETLNE